MRLTRSLHGLREGRRLREGDSLDEAEYISSQVVKYLEKKLGETAKHILVTVTYTEDGVEVEVDVDASVLVDDAYLQKVVDEAAELGVCLADLIKEKGWPLAENDSEVCWRS
ncbi:MAG: hypothetical protein QXS00_01440 [Pyrobaculum sp.]